jgi:hypothetical protein
MKPNPLSPDFIGEWDLDDATGTDVADDFGLSTGTYIGTVERSVASIISGDSSVGVGVNPTNSGIRIPHVGAAPGEGMRQSEWAFGGWFQADTLPAVDAHYSIWNKDAAGVPGGTAVELYNDSGTLRVRAYTRDADGVPVYIGSALGNGSIPVDTACRWAVAIGPTGARLHLKITTGSLQTFGPSANTIGWQDNDRDIFVAQWHTGATRFDGVMKRLWL